MPIYDESKMKQKVVYPTKQTPSYADWALFEMGKELELHGSVFDPSQDTIFKTVTGVISIALSSISIEVSEEIPTAITYGENTYALEADTESTAYKIIDETDDSLIGFIFIFGDIEIGTYVGINTEDDGERVCLYGTITEITAPEVGE